MEIHLDQELQKLNTDLLSLAALTEGAIHKSIEALKAKDQQLAEECIRDDERIDELELKIEEETIGLLALFQPMAKDLRFITTGMRINSELERVADLTVNICQRVKDMAARDKVQVAPPADISKLGDIAKWMVRRAIDAFVSGDENQAKEVILRDQEANQLRTAIINHLIDDIMTKDKKTVPQATALLLAARDLERICDQAKYIAEDVIYMIQAKVVKHHPERLSEET